MIEAVIMRSLDVDPLFALEPLLPAAELSPGCASCTASLVRSTVFSPTSSILRPAFDSFLGVANPYDVFKQIKEAAIDVKTDWSYPNALRPGVNPGYHTRYKQG